MDTLLTQNLDCNTKKIELCTKKDDTVDINYNFDKANDLQNLIFHSTKKKNIIVTS